MSKDFIDKLYSEFALIHEYYMAMRSRSYNFYLLKTVLFQNYPHNLPIKYRDQILNDLDKIKKFAVKLDREVEKARKTQSKDIDTFNEQSDELMGKLFEKQKLSGFFSSTFQTLYLHYYRLSKITGNKSIADDAFDFIKEAKQEQIVLFIAYLESYVKLCYQVLLHANPNKAITNIGKLNEKEIKKRIEIKLSKFPKSIKSRYKIIKSEYGILEKYPIENITRIAYFEQCRHCLVHNFGGIDKKFIEKTKVNLELLNTILELTDENIHELSDLINDVEFALFKEICVIYLGRKL